MKVLHTSIHFGSVSGTNSVLDMSISTLDQGVRTCTYIKLGGWLAPDHPSACSLSWTCKFMTQNWVEPKLMVLMHLDMTEDRKRSSTMIRYKMRQRCQDKVACCTCTNTTLVARRKDDWTVSRATCPVDDLSIAFQMSNLGSHELNEYY